ncbi:MAG: alpha/beta fold hydrolase [Pseudomonadota bacterium]
MSSGSAARPVKRQFVDGRFGQIHVRTAVPAEPSERPLLCLHMSPKSGRQFMHFMAAMASDRVVVAPDYPGYGESAPPPAEPHVTIEDYAQSVIEVIDALDLGPVDLLGFHTGAEVAAALADRAPARVRRIVMVSAPVLTNEELTAFNALYAPIELDLDGTRFRKQWESVVKHRGPGMTLTMMAESFAEGLRGGEGYEWGHRAAFAYAPRYPDVVASLSQRVVVLNPHDDLAHITPRIEPYLNNGELVDKPDWGHGFFDAHTDDAVATIRQALA